MGLAYRHRRGRTGTLEGAATRRSRRERVLFVPAHAVCCGNGCVRLWRYAYARGFADSVRTPPDM